MTHTYQNIYDQSKIEFISKITHKMGKKGKEKLNDDILKFKYTESQTKQGKEIDFKRSEFEKLIRQKSFVKVC